MKLIIHPGLHKTGSTFLQHALNNHHRELRKAGIYYRLQHGYPAHHDAAWQILLGESEPLADMIREAREANCTTVIVSSEDLEGALYDDRPVKAIDRVVHSENVEEVEWHVVLRDPGEAFASLFAQLQHHVYADAFQLFYDVMRRGFIHMAAPMPGGGTPYWYYAFDHLAELERLCDRTGAPVFAHDFREQGAFPGCGILKGLGASSLIERLPGKSARNSRPDRDEVIRGFVARVAEAMPDRADQQRITDGFLTCLENGLENTQTYVELIGAKYGPSHEAALSRFGWKPEQD